MKRQEHGDLAARLPLDILADVLRRVAAAQQQRWIAVSRCVCKAWRAIIDDERLMRTDLPLSGFFIGFRFQCLPEFFSRPASPWQPPFSGKLDFLPTALKVRPNGCSLDGGYYIVDHCKGLLLLKLSRYIEDHGYYVVNPATRCCNAMPPSPRDHTGAAGIVRGISSHRYHLAFDPTLSSHYQVFQIPYLRPEEIFYLRTEDELLDPLEEASEWPPSLYTLDVFSSRRCRWEERSFVRQGDAAGTLAKARAPVYFTPFQAAYWRGSLYVHCQGDFIMRISLSEDKYRVIKTPDVGDERIRYMGASEKGVYVASFVKNHIRVSILNESCDQLEWILKHDYDLMPVQVFNRKAHGPWILQDINYEIFRSHALSYINKEEVIQEKFEWNSDDDDFHENVDMVEVQPRPDFDIEILGFHPYKEILFLSRSETYKLNAMAFAYHLNSFKVECLGSIYPTGHSYFDSGLANESREIESFTYTPCCWIEEIPGRVS